MDYDGAIHMMLTQIKQGIDSFNESSPNIKANYPELIHIEYGGCRFSVVMKEGV
jgi:ATP phosphoribosyltransferase